MVAIAEAPFGGIKQTGYGRSQGHHKDPEPEHLLIDGNPSPMGEQGSSLEDEKGLDQFGRLDLNRADHQPTAGAIHRAADHQGEGDENASGQ